MALTLKANRRYPSVPVVTDDPKNHTQVLMAVKEALDTGQRRTGDLFNSFIRVQDLIDLGLITIEGNAQAIVGADLSEIANIGDLSGSAAGDFLRFDGSVWVNDQLALGDITQAMVTQHQAALSIAAAQISNPSALKPVVARGCTFTSSVALVNTVNKVDVYVPFAGTIVGVSLLTIGGPGSCVVDIWKDTYANFPPSSADSITAAAKPTIVAGSKYIDTTLTGWMTAVAAGDIIRFSLESTTTFTTIFVILLIQPT